MASTTYLDRYADAITLHQGVSAPTADPTSATTRYQHRANDTVCTYLRYSGAVSGTLRLWLYDGEQWYLGASYALDSANGDEAVDWTIGDKRAFTFSVEAISGGGSVTVRLEGV